MYAPKSDDGRTPLKPKLMRRAGFIVAMLLAACSEDGAEPNASEARFESRASYCAESFRGGETEWSCVNCTNDLDPLDDEDDFAPAIDNNESTSTAFAMSEGGGRVVVRATAPAGTVFAPGGSAGALVYFPRALFAYAHLSFSTYRNGVLADANREPKMTIIGSLLESGEEAYYAFTPSTEFDALEIELIGLGDVGRSEFRLHEFCADL